MDSRDPYQESGSVQKQPGNNGPVGVTVLAVYQASQGESIRQKERGESFKSAENTLRSVLHSTGFTIYSSSLLSIQRPI